MLGAILGDIIGSPYETPETAIKKTDFPLFTEKSHFTDDTVMTCAVGLGLMDSFGRDEETVHRTIASQMRALGRSYPGRGYGGHFQAWLLVDDAKAYGSYGNGSAMRVSAAGWLFRTLDDTLTAARLTAEVTHDHPEGIKGAQAIAAAIFLSRAHCDKADIRNYLMREFGYDLTRSVKEIRRTYQFDATCQGSVPEALICFLEGSGFVDVVRKAVSLGGDSDTLAAMAGSIAEAYYGVPENLEKEAYARLDSRLGAIVRQFHSFYRANSGRPLNGWQNEVYYDPDPELTGLGALEFAISDFYARSGSGKLNPNLVLDEVEKLMESNGNVLVPVQKPSRTLDKEKRNGGDHLYRGQRGPDHDPDVYGTGQARLPGEQLCHDHGTKRAHRLAALIGESLRHHHRSVRPELCPGQKHCPLPAGEAESSSRVPRQSRGSEPGETGAG